MDGLGTIDLSIVGVKCKLHKNSNKSNVSEKESLSEWCGIKIERFDVRFLLDSVQQLDVIDSTRENITNEDTNDDKTLLEQLDFERYQDLPVDNDKMEVAKEENVNNKDCEDDENSEADFEEWNQSTYKSNRQEIWTRPKPVEIDEKKEEMNDDGNNKNNKEDDESVCDGNLEYSLHSILRKMVDKNEKIVFPKSVIKFNIMLHTIKTVRRKGTQLEILLKVKQSENRQFSFLDETSKFNLAYNEMKFLSDEELNEISIEQGNSKCDEIKKLIENPLLLLNQYGDDEDEENKEKNDIIETTETVIKPKRKSRWDELPVEEELKNEIGTEDEIENEFYTNEKDDNKNISFELKRKRKKDLRFEEEYERNDEIEQKENFKSKNNDENESENDKLNYDDVSLREKEILRRMSIASSLGSSELKGTILDILEKDEDEFDKELEGNDGQAKSKYNCFLEEDKYRQLISQSLHSLLEL